MLLNNSTKEIDCLLIHVVKKNQYIKPLGTCKFINFMPLGLVSMANYINSKGFKCKILHLGILDLIDKNKSVKHYLKIYKPKIIGFSLHWHHQSYEVIKEAKSAKQLIPDATIILGGYTASFFAEEILNTYDFIDCIVKGEGEKPLLELLKCIETKNEISSSIPNLVYRNKTNILNSKSTWTASNKELSNYNFADLKPLLFNEKYCNQHMYIPEDSWLKKIVLERNTVKLHILCLGRGCMQNCIYCGGGNKAQKNITGRCTVSLRDPEVIASEVLTAFKYGFTGLFSDFDFPQNPNFLINVLENVYKTAGKQHWRMNIWTIPSMDFIKTFNKTTKEGSILYLSPNSGCEQLRSSLGGLYYSNSELENFVTKLKNLNIPLFLFFAYGLPRESELTYRKTLKLINKLKRLYSKISAFGYPIELDPASPMYLLWKEFSIKRQFNCLKDYINYHKNNHFEFGYEFKGFNKTKVLNQRCNKMCNLNNEYGHLLCSTLKNIRKIPFGTASIAHLANLLGPLHKTFLKTGHS